MSTALPKVNFNTFNGSAFQKIKDVRSKAFPVRVINVKATIDSDGAVVFHKPENWNFHTISHRWSNIIEDMSKEVGCKVEENLNTGCCCRQQRGSVYANAYDRVFKQKKFKGREGYDRLIDFLKILKEDGVELVWFDTLCINQQDLTEQGEEIKHMGEFYSLSLGCYTAAHGFGGGFAVLDEKGQAPAWFSRAWTLQEFLLPKILTFVVELKTAEFNSLVKMVRGNHLDAKCACGGNSGSSEWPWGKRKPAEPTPCSANDESEFWRLLRCSDYKCTRGRFERGGSGAQQHAGADGAIYFVDRNAYIPVAISVSKEGENEMWNLGFRLGLACQGESVGLVKEISERYCKFDEDRALCMLALLGVTGEGGVAQIRVKAGLDKQLLELGKAMARCNLDDLMIKLCAAAVIPNSTTGMSWMPRFTHEGTNKNDKVDGTIVAKDIECVTNMKEFHSIVERVSVSENGSLSLKCPFMLGRLLSFQEHAKNCRHVTNKINGKGCASCCRLNTTHERCPAADDDQEWVLEMSEGHALPFHSSLLSCRTRRAFWPHLMGGPEETASVESNYYFRGGFVVPHTVTDNNIDTSISNVSLLLLGVSIEDRPYWEKQTALLFMVCLGESRERLKKIGHIRALPSYTKMKVSSRIDHDRLPKFQCTVS